MCNGIPKECLAFHTLPYLKISVIVLFPDTAARLDRELEDVGVHDSMIYHAHTMDEAVRFCYDHSPKGMVCLLSPGCASYNQYANFPERGEMFKKAVTQGA